ncbi:hypothetical protein [Fundicoccus culcitae]|uniref:MucBP domain-containing protein n=1 Tax=Fundicoccus culcitae TaxID=2969821 RepID=A0ABY5P859_9LACT|nr:hypothetical protein [Fundicoccus culcitae]UUX34928.1 hypothetical protein NRE15_04590 [Fundicoccus culcitae]
MNDKMIKILLILSLIIYGVPIVNAEVGTKDSFFTTTDYQMYYSQNEKNPIKSIIIEKNQVYLIYQNAIEAEKWKNVDGAEILIEENACIVDIQVMENSSSVVTNKEAVSVLLFPIEISMDNEQQEMTIIYQNEALMRLKTATNWEKITDESGYRYDYVYKEGEVK